MSEPDWGYLWRLTVGRPPIMERGTCVCGKKPIHHSGGWWSHDDDDSIRHDDGTYVIRAT